MSVKSIYPGNNLRGEITVPGDKSVSHRSVMFGSIALGTTRITNFLKGADCRSTIKCFQRMGIEITEEKDCILVYGKGLRGLSEIGRAHVCTPVTRSSRMPSSV